MNLRPMVVLPVAALRVAAFSLRLAAATGQRVADALRPPGRASWDETPATLRSLPPQPSPSPGAGKAESDTTQPTPAMAPPPAGASVDIPTLASRTAPEVIAALDGLGSVELADLYDRESKHRRRRAVLDAIERAAAPPASAQTPDAPAEIRLPDEVVYSTQTPPR